LALEVLNEREDRSESGIQRGQSAGDKQLFGSKAGRCQCASSGTARYDGPEGCVCRLEGDR
jgi:hypothetical protein